MSTLEFRPISEMEVDRLERTPHNPPRYSAEFTGEDFSTEWQAVRDALRKRVEIFAEEWQLDNDAGDFMLSESRGDSRWIYITFVSTKLWRPEFVPAVADLLSNLPQDYRVGCLTELNDDELLEYPLVYLAISSTTVLYNVHAPENDPVCCSESEVLKKFGFAEIRFSQTINSSLHTP